MTPEYHRIQSDEGLQVLERVREICLALPGVVEEIDGFSTNVFRVDGSSFARLGESEGTLRLAFKSDLEEQQFLIQDPQFQKAPYIGQYGWVSLTDWSAVDWDELGELLEEAYLRVAPGNG